MPARCAAMTSGLSGGIADEITTLRVQTQTKGLTIVPLRLYLKGRRAKVEIAVGRGKKLYDKRAALAERDARRDIEQRQRDY